MGNTQSQNQSSNPIHKLPRKIGAKLPAVPSLRERAKDSGYQSASASSSATAVKGGRANDQNQTSATAASAGSGSSTPRPETAPAVAERPSNPPAQPTETVRPNDGMFIGAVTD